MKSCSHKWYNESIPYSKKCLSCGVERQYNKHPGKKDKYIYLDILSEQNQLTVFLEKSNKSYKPDPFRQWFILDVLEQLRYCK